jgi:hypothetical protein
VGLCSPEGYARKLTSRQGIRPSAATIIANIQNKNIVIADCAGGEAQKEAGLLNFTDVDAINVAFEAADIESLDTKTGTPEEELDEAAAALAEAKLRVKGITEDRASAKKNFLTLANKTPNSHCNIFGEGMLN